MYIWNEIYMYDTFMIYCGYLRWYWFVWWVVVWQVTCVACVENVKNVSSLSKEDIIILLMIW